MALRASTVIPLFYCLRQISCAVAAPVSGSSTSSRGLPLFLQARFREREGVYRPGQVRSSCVKADAITSRRLSDEGRRYV